MYKLLVVDDNYYERNGIAKIKQWKLMGFDEVYTAENGETGYEKALEVEPMLVITDVSMPVMDGLEMSKKILEKLPQTKFVFMSCFDNSEYIRKAIDVNAFGYILKPVKLNELKEIVNKVLKFNKKEMENAEKIKNLQIQIKENLPILKEQLTRDLFFGNIDDLSSDKLISFDMQIIKYYAVGIIAIDDFNRQCANLENDEIYVNINGINSFITESKIIKRVSSFVKNKKSIAFLMHIDEEYDSEEVVNKCISELDLLKQGIMYEFGLSVSIYIGGISDNLRDAPELYAKADYVFDNSMCSKKSTIIFAQEINFDNKMLNCDMSELKKEVFDLIEKSDMENIDIFVEKYYNYSHSVETKTIKEFTLSLISTIQLALFEMNESFDNIFNNEFLIWEKLSRFDTILDIKQWVYNVIKSIIEYLNDKKSDRYEKIAEDIKNIIDTRYMEIDNVSKVSDILYISTVHANKIFKKCMGCTMFDYLTQVKIEKAKEMLKDRYCKIYEVSEALGYKSKTYFASLFKEFTGMTPKEYRDRENT